MPSIPPRTYTWCFLHSSQALLDLSASTRLAETLQRMIAVSYTPLEKSGGSRGRRHTVERDAVCKPPRPLVFLSSLSLGNFSSATFVLFPQIRGQVSGVGLLFFLACLGTGSTTYIHAAT